jgi:hypothetical protein
MLGGGSAHGGRGRRSENTAKNAVGLPGIIGGKDSLGYQPSFFLARRYGAKERNNSHEEHEEEERDFYGFYLVHSS